MVKCLCGEGLNGYAGVRVTAEKGMMDWGWAAETYER